MSWISEVSKNWRSGGTSGAAAALLNRIIADERDRSTLAVCWIRVVFATVNALVVFPVLEVPGLSDVWPARYGSVLYMALSGLVLLLAKLKPRPFMRWAAFTPALIDVPLVGLMEWKQATYSVVPGLILPGATVMLLGFVMLSSLALSRLLIVLVTPPAMFFIFAIARAEGSPLPIIGSLLAVSVGFGPLGWVLVGKIRRLVRASRERDLLGKYILGPRLGAGGMAEVLKATYSPEGGFERAVAVKRILPQFADSADVIAMFRREAELGARLAHPNVVQVLDFGSDGATFFMAMEFIDGVSLARIINYCRLTGRRPSVALLLFLAHELALALAYVHSRTNDEGAPLNLIHRDFNPPNVMVSRIGEVKLADFGIARSADTPALTKAGLLRGKLSYAAPEQIQGDPAAMGSGVDLFALGIMLYELATMEKLFQAENELQIIDMVLHGTTPPLKSREPSLPEAFCAAVDQLLIRDRALRLSSAFEVQVLIADEVSARDALKLGRAEVSMLAREAALSAPTPAPMFKPPTDPNGETRAINLTPTA